MSNLYVKLHSNKNYAFESFDTKGQQDILYILLKILKNQYIKKSARALDLFERARA